jgi:tRNA 2-thiouridine synthesizing protein E
MSHTLPPLDADGFLTDYRDWSPPVAEALAAQEGIRLDDAHWEILQLLRAFYIRYDMAPSMRALVKFVKQELGPERGNSLYLLQLFPDSPAKRGSRIAGLPKPENCL